MPPAPNSGSCRADMVASIRAEMDAFDALPAPIRAALADAAEDWSALNILARYRVACRRFPPWRVTRRAVAAIRSARR